MYHRAVLQIEGSRHGSGSGLLSKQVSKLQSLECSAKLRRRQKSVNPSSVVRERSCLPQLEGSILIDIVYCVSHTNTTLLLGVRLHTIVCFYELQLHKCVCVCAGEEGPKTHQAPAVAPDGLSVWLVIHHSIRRTHTTNLPQSTCPKCQPHFCIS